MVSMSGGRESFVRPLKAVSVHTKRQIWRAAPNWLYRCRSCLTEM